MKNKDFRELQISSSFLVIIFVGILILGVFIFLLGVSVGKKQAQIASDSTTAPRIVTEQVKASEPARPIQTGQAVTDKKLIAEELASQPKAEPAIKPEPKSSPPKAPAVKAQTSAAAKKGLFFIQVGAFNDQKAALDAAEKFKPLGYAVIVVDPSPPINKFRIRLGGYSTREEAMKALSKLKAESKKPVDYFIARD